MRFEMRRTSNYWFCERSLSPCEGCEVVEGDLISNTKFYKEFNTLEELIYFARELKEEIIITPFYGDLADEPPVIEIYDTFRE